MSKIRSKDTGIERLVFSYLRKRKIHFRRHYAGVPGKPDVALPSKKVAIFINGDFWHGYRFNKWKYKIPKVYWRSKISGNILRDRKRYAYLRRRGWRVMHVWGHQISRNPVKTFDKIADFLSG